jgi:uncharacterized protein YukE
MIVEVPVFFANRRQNMKVEVQLRTIAMDFWASLEHKMKYKKDIDGSDEIVAELKRCADSIAEIDKRMQDFANATEMMKSIVVSHGGSNYGKQYNNMCLAVNKFSKDIYTASDVLNDLQHQVVEFENKCHVFENEPPSASGTVHNVNYTELSANTGEFQMHKDQMKAVSNALEAYFAFARQTAMQLRSNRDSICAIWLDSQSKDFSEVIEEVFAMIEAGCQVLDNYKQYLDFLIDIL